MAVIRSVLNSLGYQLSEAILNGNEMGTLENRNRLCVVALSEGINEISLESVPAIKQKESCINDILENIALDSERYKTFDYLAVKEERDIKAGKGFRRQLLNGSESKCGVIPRHYNKVQSTNPFLKHPDNVRSRLFTLVEHCRLKGIPENMIDGLSETIGHQVLGQSICFPAFQAVGRYIGQHLKSWSNQPAVAKAA
jgi:DNA (cytosine-5)-methyltransferase 1